MKTLVKRTNVFFVLLFCALLGLTAALGLYPLYAAADTDATATEDVSEHLLHRWELNGRGDLTSTATGAGITAKTLSKSGTIGDTVGVGTGGVRIVNNGFLYVTGGVNLPADSEAVTFSLFHKVNKDASDWPGLIEFIHSGSGYRLTYGLGIQQITTQGGGVSGINTPLANLGAQFHNNGAWDSFINQGGATSYTEGTYMHVTVQIDKQGVRGYRNGVLKTQLSVDNADVNKLVTTALQACKSGTVSFETAAYYSPDKRYEAFLDDLRVYDGLVDPDALYADAMRATIASVKVGEETTKLGEEAMLRGASYDGRIEIVEGESDRFVELPDIVVTPSDSAATVTNNIEDLKTSGGTEDAMGYSYTLRYTVTNGDKEANYEIPLYVYKRSVAESVLTDLKIDGATVDGFTSEKREYTYYVSPTATTLPQVTGTPMTSGVTVEAPADVNTWTPATAQYEYAVTLKNNGAEVSGEKYKIKFVSAQSTLYAQEVLDDAWTHSRMSVYTHSSMSGTGRSSQKKGYLSVQGGAGVWSAVNSGVSKMFGSGVFGSGLTGITVNAWIRLPADQKQGAEAAIFTLMASNYRVDVRYNGGFRVSVKSGSWSETAEDFENNRLSTGTWRMVSLVVRPDNAYFYIDGVQAYTAENGDVKGKVNWREILTNGVTDVRVGRSYNAGADTILKGDIRAVQTYTAPLGEAALRGLAASVKNTGIDVEKIELRATGRGDFTPEGEQASGYVAADSGAFADVSDKDNLYITSDDDDNIDIFIVSDKRDSDIEGLQNFPALLVPKIVGSAQYASAADTVVRYITTREGTDENEQPITEFAYDVSGRKLTWTVTSVYAPNGTEDRLYRKNYTVTVQYCSADTSLGTLTVDGAAVDVSDNKFYVRKGQNYSELSVVATPGNAGGECIVDIDATEGRLSVRVLSEFGGKMAKASADYYRIYRFSIVEASNNNYLSSVSIGGVSVVGFDRKTTDYTVGVPYGTGLYDIEITANPEESNATVSAPVFDEATRSAQVTVTSVFGEKRVYTFRFEDRSALTTLSSILIDGEVIEGFDKDVHEYFIHVDDLGKVGNLQIAANPVSSGAVSYIKLEADRALATVTVTSEVGNTDVYVLRFTTADLTPPAPEKEGCGSSVTPVSAAIAAVVLLACAMIALGKRSVRRNG